MPMWSNACIIIHFDFPIMTMIMGTSQNLEMKQRLCTLYFEEKLWEFVILSIILWFGMEIFNVIN